MQMASLWCPQAKTEGCCYFCCFWGSCFCCSGWGRGGKPSHIFRFVSAVGSRGGDWNPPGVRSPRLAYSARLKLAPTPSAPHPPKWDSPWSQLIWDESCLLHFPKNELWSMHSQQNWGPGMVHWCPLELHSTPPLTVFMYHWFYVFN